MPMVVSGLDGSRLHELFKARFSESLSPAEWVRVTSIDEAERLAANPDGDAEMLDTSTYWRYPRELAELVALRVPDAGGRPVESDGSAQRTIRVLPWHRPALTLDFSARPGACPQRPNGRAFQ